MVRLKPNRSRYTIPGVDRMRAEVSANTASLANAASMSWEVVAEILQEVWKPKTSCERVINGLKKLGHPTADLKDIVEHAAPVDGVASVDADASPPSS